jgi:hypothetical protein
MNNSPVAGWIETGIQIVSEGEKAIRRSQYDEFQLAAYTGNCANTVR